MRPAIYALVTLLIVKAILVSAVPGLIVLSLAMIVVKKKEESAKWEAQ